ncbi:Gfo/Idh/MocA family protein [Caballeronia sp. S22]|uniref:Gfo/Idh/MocA family protein n=1 Tax=Caballeronia sp. S22 TaxID=3137182 RepID=UPI0035310291
MNRRFRVGIVGQIDGRRGTEAHIQALRVLADDFDIAGVANPGPTSAQEAAAFGIPRAFDSVAELVASDDIDVVTFTEHVPRHREVVAAAIETGKDIYCEWPLGAGLTEASELTRLANETGVLAVIGTRAIVSPELNYVRRLVANGFVGDVLSSTYLGAGFGWGDEVVHTDACSMGFKDGATLLSVIGGHAIAAIQRVLDPIQEVGGTLPRSRGIVKVRKAAGTVQMRASDHVMVNAILESGAPLSLQLRGGFEHKAGLLWEINGTKGDLRITAEMDEIRVTNRFPVRVELGRKGLNGYHEIEVPRTHGFGLDEAITAGNLASIYRLMANDLRNGTHTAPDFDDALVLHMTIDAIEQSAKMGRRVRVA